MEFVFFDELPGSSLPTLRVLERSSQDYHTLIYQHQAALFARADHIGNDPKDPIASQKLQAFFDLAKQTKADLVLTPEYSCPWNVITGIINDQNRWPEDGKLWVIGGESISPIDLKNLRDNIGNNIKIFFDEARLEHANNFFDPAILLFIGKYEERTCLNVLIQFKTHHMSVWSGGDIEADNIILGNRIYILRNAVESIYYMTLICSEAMNFPTYIAQQTNRIRLRWEDQPYLIANIQANGDPTHKLFLDFRATVMQQERKDIISVNWGSRSTIGELNFIPNEAARSGYFMRSSEFNFSDETTLKNNHKKGLYYFNYALANKHAFILNGKMDVFKFKISAVAISGVLLQQARKNGPVLDQAYRYEDENTLVPITPPADDLCIIFLNEVGCQNLFLSDSANCILEKERLVCISSGNIGKAIPDWYKLENLFAFRTDDQTEINRRMTCAEATSLASVEQRTQYVIAVDRLQQILNNHQDLFPPTMEKWKGENLQISYHQHRGEDNRKTIIQEQYKYNVIKVTGEGIKATLCYLDHPTTKHLAQVFEDLQGIFADNVNKEKVVIFFHKGTDLTPSVKFDTNAGSILGPKDHPESSILN